MYRRSAVFKKVFFSSKSLHLSTLSSASTSTDASSLSIKDRLQRDLIAAMRAKDTFRSTLIRQLQADLVRQEKSAKPSTAKTNSGVDEQLACLQSSTDRWRDTIAEYSRLISEYNEQKQKTANHPAEQDKLNERLEQLKAVLAKEQSELDFIQTTYLPPAYTGQELEDLLASPAIPSSMSAAMARLGGKIDFGRISRKHLGQLVMQIVGTPAATK